MRFFRFGCDFGRLFGRDLGSCLRFDFYCDCGCRYVGCIRFAFGIRNALVVLNALVILHACMHSIIVHDRCNCDCCDRRSRVIRFMAFSVGSRRFPYYPALCSLVHFVLVEECVQGLHFILFCRIV